jgi:hypothetical protein
MGRNREKGSAPVQFTSWEAFDAAMREENSRYHEALNALTRKYNADNHTGARKQKMWVMDRIDNAFAMEERRHEARVAKIDARHPDGPWPEMVKANENPDGGFAALGGGA